MGGIRETYRKLQRAKENIPIVAQNAIDETKDFYLDLNREQLMEGKNKVGENLSPSYLDDPYFKSKESAQRYSDWKDKITPNPKRQKGIPNLYINGVYHNSIKSRVINGKIVIDSSFKSANEIEGTYKGVYGLSTPFQVDYIKKLRPVFNQLFLQKLK
jgi:hypothetical protein